MPLESTGLPSWDERTIVTPQTVPHIPVELEYGSQLPHFPGMSTVNYGANGFFNPTGAHLYLVKPQLFLYR
jgi:hypothetical protein